MAQTATQWLEQTIKNMINNGGDLGEDYPALMEHIQKAKQKEETLLKRAMIYALDEDGHTGDWKIRFVNDYYNKTFESEKEKFDQDESGYPIH